MAMNLTPEEKKTGEANFKRAVGQMANAEVTVGPTRRRFMQGMLAAGAALPLTAAAYYGYNNANFGQKGPLKVGLIGTGDQGGVHVGEHNPRYVEFVALSDIRPYNQARIFDGQPTGPRKGLIYHYGSDARKKIPNYEDYRELLKRPDIEAVLIALPINLHAQVAIDAMEAGKHVFCEKLMAANIEQCKAMIRKADETKKVLSIGHQRHYSMLYAHANEIVNSGVLGEIHHIRAQWHRNMTQNDYWKPDIRPATKVLPQRFLQNMPATGKGKNTGRTWSNWCVAAVYLDRRQSHGRVRQPSTRRLPHFPGRRGQREKATSRGHRGRRHGL